MITKGKNLISHKNYNCTMFDLAHDSHEMFDCLFDYLKYIKTNTTNSFLIMISDKNINLATSKYQENRQIKIH